MLSKVWDGITYPFLNFNGWQFLSKSNMYVYKIWIMSS